MKIHSSFALLCTLALCSVACTADSEETAAAPVQPSAPPAELPDDVGSPQDDEATDAGGDVLPEGGLCDALFALASSNAAVSDCEEIIAADCERIVGTLSTPYVDAVEQCIGEGGDIFGCLTDSVEAFEKTASHEELAATFCDDCALGVPGCEDLFYVADSEWGVGTVLLPFSSEVLDAVGHECTSSFFCAADFPTCAMGVIQERLEVDASRECLMQAL